MKKFLTLALLCLFVATGALFAQVPGMTGEKKQKKSDLSATVPIDKNVRKVRMDNGMTYYLRVNKKPEERIQFRLVTNAGSILEDDSQQGLAHFCEHMAFNGTEHYPHILPSFSSPKEHPAFSITSRRRSKPSPNPTAGTLLPPISSTRSLYLPPPQTVPWLPITSVTNSNTVRV